MKRSRVWGFLIVTLLIAVPYITGRAAPPWGEFVLERVSLGDDESEANALSRAPSITLSGLFVAFESDADNLIANDTNGERDIFFRHVASGITERLSISTAGVEANGGSFDADMSASGERVIFTSSANNLVAGDTNGRTDIFLRDRGTNTTTMISVDSTGGPADSFSDHAKIAPDGEAWVYRSQASDLVAGDTNGVYDCFYENLNTGNRIRILTATGDEPNADCDEPDVSDGTRRVVFSSEATNLVPTDTNNVSDVFLFRPGNGNLRLISVSSDGTQGNAKSVQPSLSESGQWVAFTSDASNLVPDDTNNVADIFVHALTTGITERVSVASDGTQANGQSIMPFISQDGRYVLFSSRASNLPGGNGGFYQVYIHDRVTGVTALVSADENGVAGNNTSLKAALSQNNEMVVFESSATNLVPDDTNDVSDVFRSTIGSFPQPTATPTVTRTPTPTRTPSPTPTGTLIATPSPSATPTGTLTATPTLDPTEFPPTATPTGTRMPPTNTPSATPTLDPTEFPPTLTATGTITPPTSTPGATPTLDPTEFPVTPTPDGTETVPTVTPTGTVVVPQNRLYLPLVQGA